MGTNPTGELRRLGTRFGYFGNRELIPVAPGRIDVRAFLLCADQTAAFILCVPLPFYGQKRGRISGPFYSMRGRTSASR